MKKLLEILGAITIAGSGISGIVANKQHLEQEQKNKISKYSEINYLQTNNLEKLKRIKRSISVNEKIKFFGYYDDYKGHISLNSVNKKILFFGNHEQFHEYFDGKKLNSKEKIYNKIIIKNENNQLIKEIIINGTESMQDIISKYNLQNGINYQDGCSLEILSTEPSRTKVFLASKWWNIHSDLKKISLKINNNQLVEYDKKINFLGLGDDYKGEIGLDTINKKIRFFGNNEWFHSYYDGSNNSSPIYNKIIIKNENNQVIKEIIINGTESMQNTISKYNLQNGINYQDGYSLEILSTEPSRTKVFLASKWWNIRSDLKKISLKINNNNFIESEPFLLFKGLDDNYKGEIVVDVTNKKILFFGNDEQFHYYFDGKRLNSKEKIYNKIIIKNENNQVIKEIIINGTESMQNIISKYNLQNGISYQDEYIIEIWSEELWRTQFYENNKFNYLINDRTIKKANQQFKIKDNFINNFYIKYNLNNFIKINNLKIDNNSDKSILNELNYLNPDLNISQIEATDKTNSSAIIKAKNNSNKYYGEKKIFFQIDNQTNKIVDLNDLIKKGIFLSFRDKNKSTTLKEIKNINIDNLIYLNVTVTKNIEPIINKTNENICSGKTILENNLPTEQKLRTSNCKYTIQEIKSFQITTGLSKTTGSQTNSEVSSGFANSNSSTSSSQVGHSQSNSSSKSWEASGNAGFSLFGFSIGVSGGGGGQTSSTSETSSLTSYSSTQDITKSIHNSFSNSISLSNSFDLGNSQEMQNIKIFELELPFQEINVEGNQTIEVSTFLDKVLAQIILNLKQNITGEINAEIINNNNDKTTFTFSIKEIMQKLQQYNLLPEEITINGDDSITFNGKANFSYQFSTIGKTKLTEIETF